MKEKTQCKIFPQGSLSEGHVYKFLSPINVRRNIKFHGKYSYLSTGTNHPQQAIKGDLTWLLVTEPRPLFRMDDSSIGEKFNGIDMPRDRQEEIDLLRGIGRFGKKSSI
jgi:hypothetical protein